MSEDKFNNFRWIAGIITMVQEDAPWVVVPLIQITKSILSFIVNGWWTLVHYRLSPIKMDSNLSPDKATLVAGIIEEYKINVAKIIVREIPNWTAGGQMDVDTLGSPILVTPSQILTTLSLRPPQILLVLHKP
ncbi:hypothetical protein FXO38_33917 [Capsicum annuum]|nr:hypothetical protein FXO38_33917 [Capsicum annuum]